jgi:isoleucyl-tRNA synthetase
VRRSRRRFWKSGSDTDKMAAYGTLYECLLTVSRLLAPFTPFVAEELYRNLTEGLKDMPESVHLADFPSCDKSRIDAQLSEDIRLAMDLSSLGRAVRSQAAIKVRQPLPVIHFGFGSVGGARDASLSRIKSQLLDELNVKDVKWGARAEIEALEKEGCSIAGDDIKCAVNPDIPESLKNEGMAREIVHRVQTMRRSAGFEIADHIEMYYQGDDIIRLVMHDSELADYIRQETLSDGLIDDAPPEGVYAEVFKLEGHEVKLGVKKAAPR